MNAAHAATLKAVLALGIVWPACGAAQVAFPTLPQPVQTFSSEDKDWGVAPTASPKGDPYHAPTPISIPGGRVVRTLELQGLLGQTPPPVVIDVLNSRGRKTVPGAVWMTGAGDRRFFASEKARFVAALDKLTGGDKARPLVFLCVSSECWISYNAALHAIDGGFKDVLWYRGGSDAWKGANLELKEPTPLPW